MKNKRTTKETPVTKAITGIPCFVHTTLCNIAGGYSIMWEV